MHEIASRMQLRMAVLRWALFLVPLVLLAGFAVSDFAGSGDGNPWFAALTKPAAQPQGWVFGAAWSVLYALMGFALALVVSARGARNRGLAIGLFAAQLAVNLFWPIYFFGMHQVTNAFYVLVLLFALASATTLVFGRVRTLAAWLMVPYLAWLCFAAILNKQIDTLNPDAETLKARGGQAVRIERPGS